MVLSRNPEEEEEVNYKGMLVGDNDLEESEAARATYKPIPIMGGLTCEDYEDYIIPHVLGRGYHKVDNKGIPIGSESTIELTTLIRKKCGVL